MAPCDTSETTPEQIVHVSLSAVQIMGAVLIFVIFYWCIYINVSKLTAVVWVL